MLVHLMSHQSRRYQLKTQHWLHCATNSIFRHGQASLSGLAYALQFPFSAASLNELSFDDLYIVKWKHVLFWTSEHSPGGRRRIRLTSTDQVPLIAEFQVIFFNDKTARPGESKARSFWAIKDQSDSRCIARDMARLWLISERNNDYDVWLNWFKTEISWGSVSKDIQQFPTGNHWKLKPDRFCHLFLRKKANFFNN